MILHLVFFFVSNKSTERERHAHTHLHTHTHPQFEKETMEVEFGGVTQDNVEQVCLSISIII